MARRKEFDQFEHIGHDSEYICYLYCLDPPYMPEGAEDNPSLWAGHYLGSSPDFERRDSQQGGPEGARLLQVQKEAGGTWHLVRTWLGDREKEFQLKTRAGKAYCPKCSDHPVPGTSPRRKDAKYLSRRQRRERQAARETAARETAEQEHADEIVRTVREIRDAGLNGYSPGREPGLSHSEAQALLHRPEPRREPELPDALQRIEALEASWRREIRQRTPELELEAGLYERGGRRGIRALAAANRESAVCKSAHARAADG
jgi:hypothetical protein